MKYEKKLEELKKLQENKNDWFKPLERSLPRSSPRGQAIGEKHFKTLSSRAKSQFWNEDS